MNIINNLPIMNILALFMSALVILLIRKKYITKYLTIVTLVYCSIASLFVLVHTIDNGNIIYKAGHYKAPWGIEMYIGTIEALFSFIFSFIGLCIIAYSFKNIDKEIKESKIHMYYSVINILIAALMGIVFSFDLFNAFVFIEISSIASITIILIKDKKENLKAALKYLILSSLGSGLFLMSIAFIYSISGNLNMIYIQREITIGALKYKNIISIAMALTIVGLGVKAALFPLHIWLPDAHSSAPTASSAVLSGLVLKAYAILIIKIMLLVFGENIIYANETLLKVILLLAILGMILGSTLAVLQKNVKKIIAYSTVAQMGYVFFGIGLGSIAGLKVSLFHMVNHSIIKSMLFLAVGSMVLKVKSKDIKSLNGIGKEMPFTLSIFTLGAMSMVGIPPLPGFISKFNFAMAVIDKGSYILIGVILISSLLNGAYYFPIIINGFFGEENLKGKKYKEKKLDISEMLPLGVLAAVACIVGFTSSYIFNIISIGLNGYIGL